jgi:hypothetical protein
MGVPTLTEFLANSLTPQIPKDTNTECPICTTSYRVDTRQMVALSCLHDFHRICIETWAIAGPGVLATCPLCRIELCRRPTPFVDEGTASVFDGEEYYADLEEGWEGLSDATLELSETECDLIRMLIDTEKLPSADLGSTVGGILASYNTQPPFTNNSIEQPMVPGSVQEYVRVVAIIEVLWHIYEEAGWDSSEMLAALDELDDFEEHAETRSISEAYRQAGFMELASRVHVEDAGVDILSAQMSHMFI